MRSTTSPCRRSGWFSGIARAMANCFTAPVEGRMPRPAARSGCVRTKAMLWPASANRARAAAANCGVPAKIRRREAGSGGLTQLLRQLCAYPLLLQLRQVLDEHLALEVIHLVLNAHGQQTLGFEREGIPVLIERAHFHPFSALDQLVDTGHGEAAFLDVGYAGRLDDFRI